MSSTKYLYLVFAPDRICPDLTKTQRAKLSDFSVSVTPQLENLKNFFKESRMGKPAVRQGRKVMGLQYRSPDCRKDIPSAVFI
jgi:hypothetical protein